MLDRSMSSLLPCGTTFDALKGECCATNCRESFVAGQKDLKLRHRAVDACRYWTTDDDQKMGAAAKKAGAKARKK